MLVALKAPFCLFLLGSGKHLLFTVATMKSRYAVIACLPNRRNSEKRGVSCTV